MADEPKGNAPAHRVVERRNNDGSWSEVSTVEARSSEAAITEVVEGLPEDKKAGVYRSMPTRFISEAVEVKIEQVTAVTLAPAGAPAPVAAPPADPDAD